MSFCDEDGIQLSAAELQPEAVMPRPIAWEDYATIMRAVAHDPETTDVDERLRLTYALMDLADRAGVTGHPA